jgi:hypothetical protein
MAPITKAQTVKLQVLYGQLASRDLSLHKSKESRLAWATELLQKPVVSFTKLTSDEARRLINSACGALGIPFAAPKPYDRTKARRRALDGRHDGQEFADQPQIVSAAALAEIATLYAELGMDKARFDAFMQSRLSPLGAGKWQIRTAADANKVRFGLLGMIRRQDAKKVRAA